MAVALEAVGATLEVEEEVIRLGFVGPSSKKWTYEGLNKAKDEIIVIIKDFQKLYPDAKIVIVSGGCPVGRKRAYCATCNSFVYGRSYDLHLADTDPAHETIEVYDEGGIDTLAEIVAFQLKLETDIKRPEVDQWQDEYLDYGGRNKGFKSRNQDIADSCDYLFCIVPSEHTYPEELNREDKTLYCYHCNMYGHPSNGGCWTKRDADKKGKKTRLIVIY
jgi:hypothetical protein